MKTLDLSTNTKINTNNLKLNLSSRSFLCMISEKKVN